MPFINIFTLKFITFKIERFKKNVLCFQSNLSGSETLPCRRFALFLSVQLCNRNHVELMF